MPLLDHFHGALKVQRHWESFHAAWACYLAEDLNRRLPEHYFAEEFPHAGAVIEIDVGTFDRSAHTAGTDGSTTATLPPQVWSPPTAAFTIPAVFADDFEVRVFSTEAGPTLVAAIELAVQRGLLRKAGKTGGCHFGTSHVFTEKTEPGKRYLRCTVSQSAQ